jgi:ABC-type nickel/cobalt efflux system permease component RcnA
MTNGETGILQWVQKIFVWQALHQKCCNEEHVLTQRRQGAKKTPWKRGSDLRLGAFARGIFLCKASQALLFLCLPVDQFGLSVNRVFELVNDLRE